MVTENCKKIEPVVVKLCSKTKYILFFWTRCRSMFLLHCSPLNIFSQCCALSNNLIDTDNTVVCECYLSLQQEVRVKLHTLILQSDIVSTLLVVVQTTPSMTELPRPRSRSFRKSLCRWMPCHVGRASECRFHHNVLMSVI